MRSSPNSARPSAATSVGATTSPPRPRCHSCAPSAPTGSTALHRAPTSSRSVAVASAVGTGRSPPIFGCCSPRLASKAPPNLALQRTPPAAAFFGYSMVARAGGYAELGRSVQNLAHDPSMTACIQAAGFSCEEGCHPILAMGGRRQSVPRGPGRSERAARNPGFRVSLNPSDPRLASPKSRGTSENAARLEFLVDSGAGRGTIGT